MSSKEKTVTGQSAIEYLTTYGWAVVLLFAVLAILFWIGFVNPRTPVTPTCIFSGTMDCRYYAINTSGTLALEVGQSSGHPITVTAVRCTQESEPNITSEDELPRPVTIPIGGEALVTSGNQTCFNVENGEVVPASGYPGDVYRGKLFIAFQEADTGLRHVAIADVILKYEGVVLPTITPTASPTPSATPTPTPTETPTPTPTPSPTPLEYWITVPGNPTYGTSDFLVMKFEAKNDAGIAKAYAVGTPWTDVSVEQARTACAAAGAHLMTKEEAQTINRNVQNQSGNWMSGAIGTGCMYGGHVQCLNGSACASPLPGSENDAQGWWNGTADARNTSIQNCPFSAGSGSSWGNETRRTLALSNGQIIWDWSGNAEEWLNDTCLAGNGEGHWGDYGLVEWSDPHMTNYERDTMGPPNSAWNSSQGCGKYLGCAANGRAFRRDSYWAGGSVGGEFALNLYQTTTSTSPTTGFRCAKSLAAPTPTPTPTPTPSPTPNGWIYGFLNQTDGSPIEGALLNATNASGTPTNSTNASGLYAIYGIAPGTYLLNASLENFESAASNVTVSAGAGTEANFTLAAIPDVGSLEGQVTDASGNAVSGASVQAALGGNISSNTTDGSGNYVIYGLAPGTYSMNASKNSSYLSPIGEALVEQGAATELNLTMGCGAGGAGRRNRA
jgi:hypothetical protein